MDFVNNMKNGNCTYVKLTFKFYSFIKSNLECIRFCKVLYMTQVQ